MIKHALVASLGAGIQELAYWYEIKEKISAEKYQSLIRSPSYWLVVILMILASGIGTAIWYVEQPQVLRTYLLTGAAFPLVLKKAIAVTLLGEKTKLGPEKISRSYFLQS